MANISSTSPKGGAGDVSPTGNDAGATTNPKLRKRTKTGCLTCRKRRIKCGEERPTCGNCIKSKRQCEGYNQRVIFKTPNTDWPNHPGVVSTMQYHSSMLPGTRNQSHRPSQPVAQSQDSTLTSIQPRPTNDFDFSSIDQRYQKPLPSLHSHQSHPPPHHQVQISAMNTSYISQPSSIHTGYQAPLYQDTSLGYQQSQPYPHAQTSYQPMPSIYDSHGNSRQSISQALPQHALYQGQYQIPSDQSEDQNSYASHSSVSPQSDHQLQVPEQQPISQRYNSQPHISMLQQVSSADMNQAGSYGLPVAAVHTDFIDSNFNPVQMPRYDMMSDVKYLPPPVLGMSRV